MISFHALVSGGKRHYYQEINIVCKSEENWCLRLKEMVFFQYLRQCVATLIAIYMYPEMQMQTN